MLRFNPVVDYLEVVFETLTELGALPVTRIVRRKLVTFLVLRRGDSTPPCGTPCFPFLCLNFLPRKSTYMFLSMLQNRYDPPYLPDDWDEIDIFICLTGQSVIICVLTKLA